MATELEIVEVQPSGDFMRPVIALGNGPAKRTLGFLPDQGFIDRAEKGTLLGVIEGDELLGYVLYDLPGNEVKIVHLCVAVSAQGRGVARRLVEEVAKRHTDRQRIALSCRNDYDATAVWKALGFLPRASRVGRSRDGHMLTVWVREFGHPTLFDVLGERAFVALDHNVFLDLHIDSQKRPEGKESMHLLDAWIAEYVELCVTDEIFYEIHRLPDAANQAIEQQWANQYRKLSNVDDRWTDLVPIVAEAAPRAGEADHRHVARAAAAGASYFVSRDGKLLEASLAIEGALGISVLPPEGLIVRLDRMRSEDPYRPAALEGTELRQYAPPDDMHAGLLAALLNNASGERRTELGARLRPVFADTENHEIQVIQADDGKVIAGFATRKASGLLDVPFLRVAPGVPGAHVVARHLVFDQRKRAADLGLDGVRITDPHLSRDIREVLGLEQFERGDRGWVCKVQTGFIEPLEVESQEGPLTPASAFEYEERHWPVKVKEGGIPTFIVPIRAPFAEALFDVELAGQTLLPRQSVLGLSREQVYYRKPRNSRGIGSGSRILWYVTEDPQTGSRGSIRAVSYVSEVVTGRPRSLFARFKRLGAYRLQQVLESADRSGEVMALRFTNTEVLGKPADLDELKALWAENGLAFLAPLSPTALSEHMFCLVYGRSSTYAS